MTRIHIATGLAIREHGPGRSVLLVASRYANHPQPLWNLPGGRQHPGELLRETAEREMLEETGVRTRAGALAYLSESYDPAGTHVLNVTFHVEVLGNAPAFAHSETDHVVEAAWVPIEEIASRIVVPVVREPLLAYLRGGLSDRYAGFADAGITIEWPAGSQ